MKIPHAELNREYDIIMDEIRNGRHNAALYEYLDVNAMMHVILNDAEYRTKADAIIEEGIAEYARELATDRVYSRDDYPSPE
jgi:hypothetical protein